ncbi:MAG TPA: site-2 protease family protein [Bdellovibrionota bacterium]|jgi:Zn-dependent protease
MQSPDWASLVQHAVIFFPAFLIALVVHEFAHAWMANFFGDKTSEWSGRLTLNPIAHMDLFGTVIFPLVSIFSGSSIFFGWAKPVPINPNQFTNYRKGLFWVSSAGVLMNLIVGFFSAFVLVAVYKFFPASSGYREGLLALFDSLLVINFSLAVFNLLPIPPLDGSNIVLSFLSYNASRKFLEFQQYSFYLLLFLMFSGALRFIGYPIILLRALALSLAQAVFGLA